MMTAYFVEMPRNIEALDCPHPVSDEVNCKVEKVILLNKMEYENFIFDMCVERWFIEDNTKLCRIDEEGVWHCLLVTRKKFRQCVLVMSNGCDYAEFAALTNLSMSSQAQIIRSTR